MYGLRRCGGISHQRTPWFQVPYAGTHVAQVHGGFEFWIAHKGERARVRSYCTVGASMQRLLKSLYVCVQCHHARVTHAMHANTIRTKKENHTVRVRKSSFECIIKQLRSCAVQLYCYYFIDCRRV